MAKRTREEIMADFAKINSAKPDETSQRIMAGIEASKKRNSELAKDVDKRRAEYEAKQKAAKTQQKAAKTQQTASETRPKKTPSVPTKIRSSRGGSMTAEVDDTKAKQNQTAAKARQTAAKADKEASKPSTASAKKAAPPRRALSSSDSEAKKEHAAEGARQTVKKLSRGLKRGKARYDENARITANRTRLKAALSPGNRQSRRKRGLKIGD